eukprot:4483372-Prymnesium_polylepis.1
MIGERIRPCTRGQSVGSGTRLKTERKAVGEGIVHCAPFSRRGPQQGRSQPRWLYAKYAKPEKLSGQRCRCACTVLGHADGIVFITNHQS